MVPGACFGEKSLEPNPAKNGPVHAEGCIFQAGSEKILERSTVEPVIT